MTAHNKTGPRARPPGPTGFVIVAGWALACVAASAQSPGSVTIDANRCANIQATEERLACYEAEIGKARAEGAKSAESPASTTSAPSQPAAASTTSPPAAAGPTTAASTPTAASTADAEPAPRSAPVQAAQPSEIRATITALRERRPKEYFITLDNGQIWRQRGWEDYPLRTGQKVRIYTSRWGGYRLTIEGGAGFIQVAQVQ